MNRQRLLLAVTAVACLPGVMIAWYLSNREAHLADQDEG